MSVAGEIGLNAGIALLLYLVGLITPWIRSTYRYRQTRPFWRPLARSHVTLVVGRHELHTWEPSGLIGVGDAKALEELGEYFRSARLPPFQVKFVDEIPRGQAPGGTLLCIGGPDTSLSDGEFRLISDLWRRAPTSFSWGDSSQHELAIRDTRSGDYFEPAGFPNEVTRDYALIVRTPNPYSQRETRDWVLLFAGCVGYGTWGAVQFATTPAFIEDARLAGADSFECLVAVEVANGAPGQIELVDVRRLRAVRQGTS